MSSAASEPPPGPTVRPLDYPAGGRIRTATLYTMPAPRPRPAVIVQHGLFASRALPEIDQVCRGLAASFDVVAPDLRGHGEGAGWFTWGRGERDDLLELVAFLSELHPAVGLVGFSIGGFIAILACARARETGAPGPAALVTVGAPAHLEIWRFRINPAGWLTHIPILLRTRRRRFLPAWPALRWARADEAAGLVAPVPLLVVHGSKDWLVHHSHARLIYERARAPRELLILEGARHAEFIMDQAGMDLVTPIRRFLEVHLAATARPEGMAEVRLGPRLG